jgi:hypothetical protein
MLKQFHCFLIAIIIVISSCSKDVNEEEIVKAELPAKEEKIVKEEPTKYVILLGEVDGFDINEFAENPFNDSTEVPGYLSNDLLFLEESNYSNFTRSEMTIKSSNGDYPAYIFIGPMYSLQYSSVGASGNTRKMLRTILRVDNKMADLKYGIKIGDSIEKTIIKLPKEALGEHNSPEIHYYYLIGEELSIHFEENNGLLVAIEIQVGT